MFEDMTFEAILDRLLAGAANRFPELDIREGSLIYSALAPAAVELNNLYLALHTTLEMSFADTASRSFLIRRAAERGIVPHPATRAVIEAEFTPGDLPVPIGTRFRGGTMLFSVSGMSGAGFPMLTAETAGRAGNLSGGDLTPIAFVPGLRTARIRALLVPGQDEEDTESLRRRYMESYRMQAFGGNVADYHRMVLSIDGVGGVRIVPTHQGPGTVAVWILGADYAPPSSALIAAVQEILDPLERSGDGWGLVPIGHRVTVMGAAFVQVVVSARLTLRSGENRELVLAAVREAVEQYFLELRMSWSQDAPLTVRLSQILMRILDVPGVVDVSNAGLNGQTGNLHLGELHVPRLNSLTLT